MNRAKKCSKFSWGRSPELTVGSEKDLESTVKDTYQNVYIVTVLNKSVNYFKRRR